MCLCYISFYYFCSKKNFVSKFIPIIRCCCSFFPRIFTNEFPYGFPARQSSQHKIVNNWNDNHAIKIKIKIQNERESLHLNSDYSDWLFMSVMCVRRALINFFIPHSMIAIICLFVFLCLLQFVLMSMELIN